jgi:hypothetical protein
MKAIILAAAAECSFSLEQIDVDGSAELQKQYGNQVPLLFIDGRKTFKYRLTAKQLARKISRKPPKLFTTLGGLLRKGKS